MLLMKCKAGKGFKFCFCDHILTPQNRGVVGGKRERESDRKTDRQTIRQTDRQTESVLGEGEGVAEKGI